MNGSTIIDRARAAKAPRVALHFSMPQGEAENFRRVCDGHGLKAADVLPQLVNEFVDTAPMPEPTL